jgi:preprotein translocase subunit SecD
MKTNTLLFLGFFLPLLFSFHTKEENVVTLKTGWYYLTEDRIGTSRQLNSTDEFYLIDTVPIVTVQEVEKIELIVYQHQNQLSITFKESAKEKWKIATEKSIGKKLAFILDDKLIMAPNVMEAIPNGKSSIAGHFSKDELLAIKKRIEKEMKH